MAGLAMREQTCGGGASPYCVPAVRWSKLVPHHVFRIAIFGSKAIQRVRWLRCGPIGGQRLRSRMARLRPVQASYAGTTLRLELSDVCPGEQSDGATPNHRWETLIKGISQPLDAAEWRRLRDEGQLDFGRGFMGFDVVRAVVDDILASRLRFGDLSVRWRGEPLLRQGSADVGTPLERLEQGELAERLVIETDGRFLGDGLAKLAAHPARVCGCWTPSGESQISAEARASLDVYRHADVMIQTVFSADKSLSWTMSLTQSADLRWRTAGPGDAVWVRPSDWDMASVSRCCGRPISPDFQRVRPHPDVPIRGGPASHHRWDGKVTLQPWDRNLQNVVGDVVHDRFPMRGR